METNYRNSPGLNFSTMKYYLRSPAHYKQVLEGKKDETDAMIFGRAFHTLILEPEVFDDQYLVINYDSRPEPDKTMASAKNKAWKEEMLSIGKSVLSTEQLSHLRGMKESLSRNSAIWRLILACKKEQEIEWEDPETGIICKAKVDGSEEKTGTVIDLKTCLDASFDSFRRTMFDNHYYIQSSHYANGLEATFGTPYERHIIIAIEKEPPYACGIYMLDEHTRSLARIICSKIYRLHADCLSNGYWPSYESVAETKSGITEMGLTPYQMNQIDNNRFLSHV